MSNIYLKSLGGKNWDLVIACCIETLKHGKFTFATVGVHQGRLPGLMDRGIINRIPGTRDPFEYVAPAETLKWYRNIIDGGD